jgi:hypothetical protein
MAILTILKPEMVVERNQVAKSQPFVTERLLLHARLLRYGVSVAIPPGD